MEHDGTEVGEYRAPVDDHRARRVHEVALVVPGRSERGTRRTADAYDIAGPATGERERVEGGGAARREFPICTHQRGLGRRVRRDRVEHAGRLDEDGADCRGQHRGRHGTPMRTGETRSTEEFREPVRSEKGHAGDSTPRLRQLTERAARQPATGRDPDVVGRHDDGHRRERITLLACDHGIAERLRRGAAVPRGHDGRNHPSDRTARV